MQTLERTLGLPDGNRITVTEHEDRIIINIMLGYRKTERGVFIDTFTQLTLTKQEAEALKSLILVD